MTSGIYNIIEPDNFARHGVTGNPALPDDVSFIDGKVLANIVTPLVFEVDYPQGEAPPHLIGSTIPVASNKLIQELSNAGVSNFQTFPAILRSKVSGQEWLNFVAWNVIGLISAADMSKSEFDTLMEGDMEGVETPLVSFKTLVLDSSKTRDADLFRLAESPDVILLHDRILNKLIEHTPQPGWGFDAVEVDTT